MIVVAPGCDNVEWGGTELAVVPPPPVARPDSEVVTGEGPEGTTVERLPQGPVLYYVRPSGGQGTMVPVGEVDGDSLRPVRAASNWEMFGGRFIAQHLRQGTEFALFRGGVRAGTFVVQSAAVPGAEVCNRVPQALGTLELAPGTALATEYLAMAKPFAPDTRGADTVPSMPDRTMQIVGPILAERALRARRAQLPGNWSAAMEQIKPFPLPQVRDPAFAATLVVGDSLGAGRFNEAGTAYSLFFIGMPQAQISYDTAFVQFMNYPTQGKAAPRTVDFLDWDRDDEVELLLEVYGVNGSWFEAVGRVKNRWQRIMQNRCEQGSAVPAPPPAAQPTDTAAARDTTGGRD